ncbi:MAG: PadR family transcriptional regulator, partial [Kiritimatiellaeota bacterium]|nr:PadR family transcriptional regulator [Kiritimatiellota bacterium]
MSMDFEQCACMGGTLPRLVRPAVLALLAQSPAHGYDLLRRLREIAMFAESPPDPGGVYKTLKALAAEGLVTGEWDTPDADAPGPPRRPFTLTAKGRECLANWAATLEHYQCQL